MLFRSVAARDDGAADEGRDVGDGLDGEDDAECDADEGEEDAEGDPEEDGERHESRWPAHQAAVVEDDRPKWSAFRLPRHVVVHGERRLELLLHGCTHRNQILIHS